MWSRWGVGSKARSDASKTKTQRAEKSTAGAESSGNADNRQTVKSSDGFIPPEYRVNSSETEEKEKNGVLPDAAKRDYLPAPWRCVSIKEYMAGHSAGKIIVAAVNKAELARIGAAADRGYIG